MALKVGSKAPDFSTPSTEGKDFNLDKDLFNKACILYFYPKDFTSGCTNEACGFRDTFEIFDNLNIPVYGISRDDVETHHKFRKALNLPFHLLADVDAKVSNLYDTVPLLMPFFTKRTTYLLDKKHNVAAVYENIFSAEKHIKSMVENLKSTDKTFLFK